LQHGDVFFLWVLTTESAYDFHPSRITRTDGGATTQFLSSGSQIWLEAVGGSTTATYTYGNSLIRKDGETPLFDGLGSERTVTNSSQTVTGTITFEGFGATIATTGSSSNPYKFAATSGYRDDGDAGLTHVGARYYDAQVGRFITRDTLLNQKPYLYCAHDPVNHRDPSGHVTVEGAILEFIIGKVIEVGGEAGLGGSLGGMEGAGKALGAGMTIVEGSLAAGEGIVVVINYRRKIEDYMDPDGRWDP
jgi:RHS repeat-associated protein